MTKDQLIDLIKMEWNGNEYPNWGHRHNTNPAWNIETINKQINENSNYVYACVPSRHKQGFAVIRKYFFQNENHNSGK